MILCIDGHEFRYEMENLCRVFFPLEKITVVSKPCVGGTFVYTGVRDTGTGISVTAYVEKDGAKKWRSKALTYDEAADGRETERSMGVLLFSVLTQMCGFTPKWGILTGVRPVKLYGGIMAKAGKAGAKKYFEEKLLVSKEKTELAADVFENERGILALQTPDSFSLYIGIPFCPTRCAYCSFVSSSVDKTFKLIPAYVELLCSEIKRTGEVAEKLCLKLLSVYVGGGTPTVLTAGQLGQVLDAVRSSFDMSYCMEVTVEAGRPDTVTEEKLYAMKSRGVGRISINPQTMSDDVLTAIGRRHTAAQTVSAFRLARGCGFGNINMDIIAGLPRDDEEGFKHTVDVITDMSPESITVHTLALKRAARLAQEKSGASAAGTQDAGSMIMYADSVLPEKGYIPYYLYRQSRMAGNLENTGWCKPGFENLYNVFIMEEQQTILACGCGAGTKLKDPCSEKLERIFNFKYPYEYINRFNEIIGRKDLVIDFYGKSQQELQGV
ncbi:MAG TPA: coproporphyrinogen dehydrogenase HemZ [Ruminococcaceae bacterium]|nr:coproporphyrinogen dehydrogenase HemZ [Oscillospiraceae bacterium]